MDNFTGFVNDRGAKKLEVIHLHVMLSDVGDNVRILIKGSL